jgi:hypothetical protein
MHRMVAVLDDETGVERALDEVTRLGIDRRDIDVLEGSEGVARLDADGTSHGLAGRLLRWAQWTAAEGNALEYHHQALLDAKRVLYVTANGAEEKDAVAAALTAAGGHHLAYFGRWTVEKEQG